MRRGDCQAIGIVLAADAHHVGQAQELGVGQCAGSLGAEFDGVLAADARDQLRRRARAMTLP